MIQKLRGAILISGRGSNMEALLKAAQAPDYPVEFSVVISDQAEAKGLETATAAGVQALALTRVGEGKAAWEAELKEALSGVDIVCLAGFMRLLSADFLSGLEGRVLNIHPSLLPDFPGLDVQQKALDAGVDESGCTVHIVTPEMDSGPHLGQARVPVEPGDDADRLAARILVEEHRLYPACVAGHAMTLMEEGALRRAS